VSSVNRKKFFDTNDYYLTTYFKIKMAPTKVNFCNCKEKRESKLYRKIISNQSKKVLDVKVSLTQ